MPGARFFPDARLNFAENLLRRRDDAPAIFFSGEDGPARTVTLGRAVRRRRRVRRGAARAGIRPGDRVAGYLPNMPEAIIAALGAAAIGAVWSSCSPDFGVQGVLDRFGQIEPRLLVTADGYRLRRARRTISTAGCRDCSRPAVGRAGRRRAVLSAAARRLGRGARTAVERLPRQRPGAVGTDSFEPLPFDHPLYIMYSSGTTGVPKCIVHGAGGTLIQHLKEHQLHCDIHAGDRVFYFTTCGWMMWNWLVSALASEATLVLYDGSPFHPDGSVLFDSPTQTGMTLFGTSAEVHRRRQQGRPRADRDASALDTVRTMTSTGSPLAPESFDFVYEQVKRDVHLASISGGTDIIGCFVGGNPNGPVWRGRDAGAHARHEGRGLRRERAAGPRREGRARLHDAVPVDAGRLLERPGRAQVPRRLLRAATRASGGTATTSS